MGLKEDAGKILELVYKEGFISRNSIESLLGIQMDRSKKAIAFLDNLELIAEESVTKEYPSLGAMHDHKPFYPKVEVDTKIHLTEKGISIAENPQEFESIFGYNRNN